MPDIKKYIRNPDDATPEKKGRQLDLSDWSREQGEHLAAEEGIDMTQEHWKVVEFLRNHYAEHGPMSSGRKLAEALDEAFADSGGGARLHKLFPEGPVSQGCRIAGLPLPPGTENESFGSVM